MRTVALLLIVYLVGMANAYTYVKWYLGGSFNGTTGATNVPTSSNAVGVDISNNQFFGLGSGTNGPAFTVGKDSCNNIYYGGYFTTANGVTTGPLAKYANGTFTPIGNSNTLLIGQLVQSIYVDCPTGSCNCDLWIGGNFNFTASDGNAVSVARYIASTGLWSSLGGVAAHSIAPISAQIGAVQSIAKTSTTVFFAGTFSGLLKSFTISGSTWSAALMPGATAPVSLPLYNSVPIIYDMRAAVFGSTVAVYVGGNFQYSGCSYFCGYYSSTFNVVGGTTNQPNGIVYGVGYDNNGLLYIAGNFTAGASGASNIAYTTISSSALAGSGFSFPGTSAGALPPIFRINPLDPTVYQYTSGSYAITSFGGLGFFYDADVRILFPFGTATLTNPTNLFTAIVDTPYQSSSAMIGPSMSLIIMCIVVFLFLSQ